MMAVKALSRIIQKAVIGSQERQIRGETHAQFWLGRIFELGLGTEKSLKKAMALYKKAAEQGMAEAQNSLGVYLCNQEAQNKKELGLFWLRKAAEQGYTEAQYNLALYRQKQK